MKNLILFFYYIFENYIIFSLKLKIFFKNNIFLIKFITLSIVLNKVFFSLIKNSLFIIIIFKDYSFR